MTTLELLGFGPFRLDAARRLLWRDGELVALAPRAIDVLAALARQPGQVVSKQELLERVIRRIDDAPRSAQNVAQGSLEARAS